MDPTRRSTRHLDSRNGVNQSPANDSPQASTTDSGRATMESSQRASTDEKITTGGASSSLSRDTPLVDDHNSRAKEYQENRPVRIRRRPTHGSRCYEQAFVSHIDHPSAFFLQLEHLHAEYEELHEKITTSYASNPQKNSSKWKRGDYCVAKFTDDRFYRGRIIEVLDGDLCGVVFLDFGNWNKVATNDIHLLLQEFTVLPAQAVPCSLTKSLPRKGAWSDHPNAKRLFEKLVFEQFVDATFQLKASGDHWPLCFVDLQLSSTKLNVREQMKNAGHIREVPNEEIYIEFNYLIKPPDCIIYSIPHEDEDNDDDDN